MIRLLFILCFLFSQPLLAQQTTDSLAQRGQDSILNLSHEQGKQLLKEADSLTIADSLFENKLRLELESLKASDQERRERIRLQIDSAKNATESRKIRIKRQVDSLRSNTAGAPVVFKSDTLLYIFAKVGPFSPSERAKSITTKLKKIADETYSSENFHLFHAEETSDLFYNEIIILSITDRDAFWMGKDRRVLVEDYKGIISNGVSNYLEESSLINVLWRVGLTILVVVIMFLMIFYLNKGFQRPVAFILKKIKRYLTGIKIRNYEILTQEREVQVFIFLMNIVKWVIILFIIYSALPIIFSIFPATEGIATKLIAYAVNPLTAILRGLVGYIPELMTIAVIIAVTRYFVRFLRFLSREIEAEKLKIPGFYPDWAGPTFNLVSFLVHAFAFIIIFPYLPGSDSPVFQGVSVFLGVLISLGSSSAIGNMIAGLVITYMRPFKVGERVKIGETVGDVVEKTMLVTRLRTIKNEDVTIPNASILNGQTINYSSSAETMGLILNTTITIGYDVPWKNIRDCLIEAAEMTEHVLKDPKPFVLQTELNDFYVAYQINAYTKHSEISANIYSELHSNILDVFHAAGIEIMSPHFTAYRDGSEPSIPKNDNN